MTFRKGFTPWNKGKKGLQVAWNKDKELGFIPECAFKKGNVPWNKNKKGIHLSLITEFKKGENVGKNNPKWKGGKCMESGYLSIRKPNHPFAHPNGRVFEHRLVMEKHLKRYLKPEEVVHHINGIKDDNRFCNLKLFNNDREHIMFHNSLRHQR